MSWLKYLTLSLAVQLWSECCLEYTEGILDPVEGFTILYHFHTWQFHSWGTDWHVQWMSSHETDQLPRNQLPPDQLLRDQLPTRSTQSLLKPCIPECVLGYTLQTHFLIGKEKEKSKHVTHWRTKPQSPRQVLWRNSVHAIAIANQRAKMR